MNGQKDRQRQPHNGTIDLAKFIMAIFVVAIHVRPFSGTLAFFIDDCITRLANPMFFAISVYYMFYKLEKNRLATGAKKWDSKIFLAYLRRLYLLYTVWFVLNLPNFMWQLRYNGWKMFPLRLLQTYFLSGPYDTALWFLAALIMGSILTFLLMSVLRPQIVFALGFVLHLMPILNGDYTVFIKDIAWFCKLQEISDQIFMTLGNGVTFGLCYCALGACVAIKHAAGDVAVSRDGGSIREQNTNRDTMDRKRNMQPRAVVRLQENFRSKNQSGIRPKSQSGIRFYGIASAVCLALYVAECTLIKWNHWGEGFGAQFMMVPFTYFGLQFLLMLQVPERPMWRFLQKISVVIFGVQFLVIYGLRDLMAQYDWYMDSTTVQFVAVLAVCCGIGAAVVWLGEHTRLRFLRCLY